MAIATYDDLMARIAGPRERVSLPKIAVAMSSPWGSNWGVSPLPGTAPTTAVVPARDLAGGLGQQNGGATALRIPGIHIGESKQGAGGTYILCDRLSHQGGLVANIATVQTTNLPTAALTRYTTGAGVFAGIEIHTQIGNTITTVTASYTDQGGTAAQVTPAIPIGSTAFRDQRSFLPLPCAAGDSGFRSVESVTLALSTGTAGTMGIVLYRPLLYLPLFMGEAHMVNPAFGTLGGGMPEILDDAHLFWLFKPAGAPTGAQGTNFTHLFAED